MSDLRTQTCNLIQVLEGLSQGFQACQDLEDRIAARTFRVIQEEFAAYYGDQPSPVDFANLCKTLAEDLQNPEAQKKITAVGD